MSCYENNKDMALNVDMPPEKCLSENKTINLLTLDKDLNISETTTDNNKSHKQLNIEELGCGICVECSENSKQEWMFTLYDFDGQGKVTKEDLSTLLKTLYDSVGTSLKLPSNSMKSLKLRLSVASDDNSELKSTNKPQMTQSVTTKPAKTTTTTKKSEPKFQKMNNLTDSPKKQCVSKSNIEKQEVDEERGISVEHQHLAELVQENMLRNRVEHDRPHSKKRHASRRRFKASSFMYRQMKENWGEPSAKESQARRNYYLDLAGIENSCLKPDATEDRDVGTTSVTCGNILRDSSAVSFQRTCKNGCRYSMFSHSHSHSRHKTNAGCDNVDGKGALKRCCVIDDMKNGVKNLTSETTATSKIGKNCCTPEGIIKGGKNCCSPDVIKGSKHCFETENPKNCVKFQDNLVKSVSDSVGKISVNVDNSPTSCLVGGKNGINVSATANVKLQNITENLESEISPKRTHSKSDAIFSKPDTTVVEMSSPKVKQRNPRPVSIASNVATNGSANHHKRHRQRDVDNSLAMKQVAEWIEKEYSHDLGQRCMKRHEHHHIHHHHHYYHHYQVT